MPVQLRNSWQSQLSGICQIAEQALSEALIILSKISEERQNQEL